MEKLKESITRDKEFMILRPIVIDSTGKILGGNMRYNALVELGYKEIPDEWIKKAENLTEEQKKRFILVDNAPEGMSGEWDFDVLANEFEMEELMAVGFNMAEFSDVEGMNFDHLFKEDTEGRLSKNESKTIKCPNCGTEIEI